MKIDFNKHIKPCPICGSMPTLEIKDMGRPGGHGYPGCDSYDMYCPCCKLPKQAESETIYRTAEEAEAQVIERWNEEVERIQTYLDNNPNYNS